MEAYGDDKDAWQFIGDDCRSLPVADWNDYIVYVLIDSQTMKVRYVGSTRQALARKRTHTKQIHNNPKYPVQFWTNEMIRNGTPPLFRVICHVRCASFSLEVGGCITRTEVECKSIERRIIRDCVERGADLLNVVCTDKFLKNRKSRKSA